MFNHLMLCLLSLTLIACTSALEKKDANAADIYLQLGIRYLSMNKLEVAKENLERALKNDSDNAQAHNALAVLYEKLNQFPEAKDQYETALKLTPDDLGVQNNFGRFLCEHGETQKGMELLNQAATNPLNEKQWLALTNAGRCQLTMGQEQKGKAYFKQALQLNDTYAPALLEMQKISYQNGEYWPAKGYLQKYLSVADHTSETLWYAIHTERALGNNDLANEYQNLLLEKFPLSNEAKKIGSVPR
ncbi:MAG: type IV pilus biogenesis/stability protein PilW [Methylococcaceae bacterium]